MPTFNDYDQHDEDDRGDLSESFTPAQSAAVGSAAGAPKEAPRQQAQEQSYVPWSSFTSANQEVSEREAGKLKNQVQGDVQKAQGELGAAQESFDTGLESNYAPMGKKKPSGGASIGTLQQEPATDAQASGNAAGAFAQRAEPPPATSNPWESFLGTSRGSGARAHASELGAAAAPGGIAALDTAPLQLSGSAAAGQLAGGKDLEAAAGAPAWSSLIGDTLKASQEAKALGSEAGVEALLQQNQPTPVGNSAFDAALISGAGQRDFNQLSQQYGGEQLEKGVVDAQKDAQTRWAELRGDVAARQALDRGPAPIPENERPFDTSTGAPTGEAPPQDTSGWTDADTDSWWKSYEQGNQAAQANGGKVVLSNRSGDPGPGWDRGGLGLGAPAINVWGKTTEQQRSNFWGGAGGPPVGDQSLDAATWYSLALMTPDQRAKWWNHQHPGGK